MSLVPNYLEIAVNFDFGYAAQRKDSALILDQLMREASILTGNGDPKLIQLHFDQLILALRKVDTALDDLTVLQR
ncbi:MAG: hypothetical protein ACD_40C00171G0003 [uncultured bacterium]|nr:MAG: hypothetical protein ACD_40C00171G0003 [uncultured bacterium]